jgi:hypothetical protein
MTKAALIITALMAVWLTACSLHPSHVYLTAPIDSNDTP